MAMLLAHFSGPLVVGTVPGMRLPREWGEVGDGVFTPWCRCWKVRCGNGILLNSRLT